MVILRRLLLVLLLLLVLVFGMLFSLQNNTPVPLDLFAVQLSAQPVAMWLLAAFALGGLIGMVFSSVAVVRLRASRARLQRKLDQREKDLLQAREQGTQQLDEPRELTVVS